jgi:hypothetical protein
VLRHYGKPTQQKRRERFARVRLCTHTQRTTTQPVSTHRTGRRIFLPCVRVLTECFSWCLLLCRGRGGRCCSGGFFLAVIATVVAFLSRCVPLARRCGRRCCLFWWCAHLCMCLLCASLCVFAVSFCSVVRDVEDASWRRPPNGLRGPHHRGGQHHGQFGAEQSGAEGGGHRGTRRRGHRLREEGGRAERARKRGGPPRLGSRSATLTPSPRGALLLNCARQCHCAAPSLRIQQPQKDTPLLFPSPPWQPSPLRRLP